MGTHSYWRDMAIPIIRNVIATVGTSDDRALQRALREAYPWGEKRMHPYKVWRHEVRRQLAGEQHPRRTPNPVSPGQLLIFDSVDS
jgi:hypothetical protein